MCEYKLNGSPVAIKYGGSAEFVQEILVANAKVTGTVPAASTIFRSTKKAIHNRRDQALQRVRGDMLCVQFDGKDNYEAYVMTHLTPDGEQQSMQLEVLKSKKALTGKEQALQMIEDLPIKSKEVLVVCSDTTAVNSGTGKVGGACFWYQDSGAF